MLAPALIIWLSWKQYEIQQLLTLTLELQRERGNNYQVAETLRSLSDANQQMGLHEEGV